MTDARLPFPRDRRLWLRLAAGWLVATLIVAVGVWPNGRLLGLGHAMPLHAHLPQLWRVAHASLAIKLHLAGVAAALAVGLALLAGVKGGALHRTLGWAWVAAMMTAAVSSLFIRVINHGQLSFIHLLSGWTILALPLGVWFARRGEVRRHSRTMLGLFTGGLLLAGLFAFLPGRLMWQMVFG